MLAIDGSKETVDLPLRVDVRVGGFKLYGWIGNFSFDSFGG